MMDSVTRRRNSHRDDLTRIEILALLGNSGPLNRSEIADRLGLGPATVTEHTRRLVAGGYLLELPPLVAGVGRPRVPLSVQPDAAYTVGLRVNSAHVVRVAVRLDGTVVRQDTEPFEPSRDPIDQLAGLATGLIEAPDLGGRVRGVGVALPGLINPTTGTVRMSPRLGWTDLPLGPLLGAELPVPVLVDNDLRASTTTELLFGTGRRHDDFLVLGIGEGIGLGIVLDRRIHRGRDGFGGEFGHIQVVPDGPECLCGARGCLDAVAGSAAIVREATARGLLPARPAAGRTSTVADLESVRLAAADSAGLRALLADLGTILGRAVAGVVNLLAVRAVTVIGESHVLWPYLEPGFRAATATGVLAPLRDLEVMVRPWHDSAHARGAASLALARGNVLS
jgi:predicted NBD/HSP70 family sugar kinase